ncbi:MAG: DNA glycosylase AlkZ-like family protein [Candidatus Heimdallarchaeota archaeon]
MLKQKSCTHYLDILQSHLGLHSTDYFTPYLSLWARIKDFNPNDLFTAINQHIALRKRAYRGTVFVIHNKTLRLIIDSSEYFTQKWVKGFVRYSEKDNVNLEDYTKKITSYFTNGKELTIHELKKEIDIDVKGDFLSLFLRYLELNGTLVRSQLRYISDRVIRYGLLTDIYPDLAETKLQPLEAISTLLKSYIDQYGPVSLDDFCWWLPLSKTNAKKALAMIIDDLIEISFDERQCYMTNDDHNKLDKFEVNIEEPIINFLPYEDHFPKAYTNRSWFLSDEVKPYLFEVRRLELGQLRPSIWLNDEIVGRWEFLYQDKSKTSMTVEIKYLNEQKTKAKKITKLIMEKKEELEDFINSRLLPLAKKQ